MCNISESLNLMRKLAELPQKEEELTELGFDKEGLESLRHICDLVDPTTREYARRVKEIIDKVERGETLVQGANNI